MSAAYLELAWDKQSELVEFTVPTTIAEGIGLVRQIGAGRRAVRCPDCRSIIYSRRHRLCGVCGEALPEQLLFSVAEARRVEYLLDVERQQHRKWLRMQSER